MEMFIGFEVINILEEKIAQIDDKVLYESKENSVSCQSRARLAKFESETMEFSVYRTWNLESDTSFHGD